MNSEADRLTDGDTRGFDPELRVRADIRQLRWLVLNWLMEAGSAFHRQSARHSKKDSRGLVRKQATHYARRKKALKERESLGDGAGTPGAWGLAMAGGPCSGFSRVPDDRAVFFPIASCACVVKMIVVRCWHCCVVLPCITYGDQPHGSDSNKRQAH